MELARDAPGVTVAEGFDKPEIGTATETDGFEPGIGFHEKNLIKKPKKNSINAAKIRSPTALKKPGLLRIKYTNRFMPVMDLVKKALRDGAGPRMAFGRVRGKCRRRIKRFFRAGEGR